MYNIDRLIFQNQPTCFPSQEKVYFFRNFFPAIDLSDAGNNIDRYQGFPVLYWSQTQEVFILPFFFVAIFKLLKEKNRQRIITVFQFLGKRSQPGKPTILAFENKMSKGITWISFPV